MLLLTPYLLWNSVISILSINYIFPHPSNQQGFNLAMLDNFPKSLKFTYKISSTSFIPQICFSITRIQEHTELFPPKMGQDHNLPNNPWHK